MAVFKCKMCGGALEFESEATVAKCPYCGTRQTLPRLDDDRRANLYDRANHFRRNNDFDKAAGIYERILNEDPADAEAYWSLVLCRYGIEYVEDPKTHKRHPTVNRAQFTSVFDDEDYKAALSHADTAQKAVYEEEAAAINEIQKGILAISQKETPFDVFICYKETDANGRRTPDSVLANDLYHQLTQEGFKVFFSRITLEDKLGVAYEPYIFAALNSAKVMVVLGTRPEYFNAVWVKNEWSRYLSLVKASGGKKVLIPAYRDMDPYDLPEEFSHLQAQDMSKLGFMQDLIRGIKKIAKADEPRTAVKETVVVGGNANTAPLLRRAAMFLEDGEWDRADDFCEQVLNTEPENAQAYVYKLMAELKVHTQAALADCAEPFDDKNNYRKAIRFGGKALASELNGYTEHINERNEAARLERIYHEACLIMASADNSSAFSEAAERFKTIPGYRDSDALAGQCLEKAEEIRRKKELARLTNAYNRAVNAMNTAGSEEAFSAAAYAFKAISGFQDADALAGQCLEKAEELRRKKELDRLTDAYNSAVNAMNRANSEKSFIAAANAFKAISGFQDADTLADECCKKAEREKKKFEYLVAALRQGDKPDTEPTPEERLAAAKARIGTLEQILKVFKATKEQINAVTEEINGIALQEKQLSEQRSGLGLFAVREKKQIDEKLSALSAKKNGLAARSSELQKTIGGYSSEADVETELAKTRNEVSELNARIEYERASGVERYSYKEAADIYLSRPDIAQAANAVFPAAVLIPVKLGQAKTFRFGRYFKDIYGGAAEPIEWLVLAREGNKAFVLSRYALDCKPYHNVSSQAVKWKTCSLRKWLNETFLNKAFTPEEQNSIVLSPVTADHGHSMRFRKGNTDSDKVFLLSYSDVENYLPEADRPCKGTAYCRYQGAKARNGNCTWWLMSEIYDSTYGNSVGPDGSAGYDGNVTLDHTYYAVRPAMWIDLG